MKILVVGSGGREHALCWKLAQSQRVDEVICAPGNGGISRHARCVDVPADDIDALLVLAVTERVDLVVVGPEVPLVLGLADRLDERGIPVFGPSAAAAQLEGSKEFSKQFMLRHGIPTAQFTAHEALDEALAEVEARPMPCVVKADGLAAGKGVIICQTRDEARAAVREMLADGVFGSAGARVVIEDFLVGEEASILAISDGRHILPLLASQDHKAAYDGDAGPNTGGMGAYCPAPLVTPALLARIEKEVLLPTVNGMAAEGHPFRGVLYAGLMIDGDDIRVLEFNVRFGDPECQPLLALLESDLADVLYSAALGRLPGRSLSWRAGAALCVVLAAGGYPGPCDKGQVISVLESADAATDAVVFHAGTRRDGDRVVTNGGRVLGVTGVGGDLRAAQAAAYRVADGSSWSGMRMRRDIGHRALSPEKGRS